MRDVTPVVAEIIDARTKIYGPVVESYSRMAQVWSGIIGTEVQPWMIPLCMMGMKQVRATYSPDYSDHTDDIEGYNDIFRQLIGEDMIHARTAKEYAEKKFGAAA